MDLALNHTYKVDMPEKGVLRRRIGKSVYAYYAVRAYRNERGKPTNERVSIGKIDEETGKLIPNRNYYEVFKGAEEPKALSIKSYGVTYLIDSILRKLKLDQVLRTKFPELSDQIIVSLAALADRKCA